MESKYTDLSRFCRTCKTESSDMRPLDTRDTEDGIQNLKVDEMLTIVTNIKVEESDKLPNSICNPCFTQLKSAFKFKQLCETTYEYYKQLLSTGKQENVNEPKLENANLNCIEILVTENNVFEKIFKCKHCNKEYLNIKHLNRHELTHVKSKIHVCKICNMTISRVSHLKRHLQAHVQDKPFKCDSCNRSFNRLNSLKEHQSKCKGHMIYSCKICSKGFNREDSCMVHEKMHEKQQCILPTLETLHNFNEFYIEVDLNDESLNLLSEASDGEVDDIEGDHIDIPCEVLVSPISDKDPLLEINDNMYAVEDPPEIMEEKARIEKEMEEYENQNSSDSEYFPIPQKRKRGRPRQLTSKRGRPKRSKLIEGEHSCPECKQVFPDLTLLEDHMMRHECPLCKKRFIRFTHLRRHILTHSESKPYSCAQCDKSFSRLDHLQQHNKVHEPGFSLSCEFCGLTFSRQPQLKRHLANQHNIQPTPAEPEKKFVCTICRKSFTTEKYRNIHLKKHSIPRQFQCHICEKTFTSKSYLSEHLKFHSESSKKFLCSECGQRFIRNDYLIIHMRRHRGEKPFKCKYCGKGFPRTTDLHVHERYHTGEKTHLCVICGRGFGRGYNLRVHMRTHTGEKPYQCTYCPAAFAQGNDLKAHVRRHTGERFQCDLCEETFLMGYLLTQHKRSVHGLNIVGNIRRLVPKKPYATGEEEPETVSLPEPVIVKPPTLVTQKYETPDEKDLLALNEPEILKHALLSPKYETEIKNEVTE